MRNLILIPVLIFLTISSSILFGKVPDLKNAKDLEYQWLIIFSSTTSYAQAAKTQSRLKVKTHIIHSDDYDNLGSGWYLTCLSYPSKSVAMKYSESLKEEGMDNYVKYSGTYRGEDDYLIKNHFTIHNGYLLLDYKPDHNTDIKNVLDFHNGRPYSVTVSLKPDAIPDQFAYLINKEVIVYDGYGRENTARITDFVAFNQINPHFGAVQRWSENDYSEDDIVKDIINYGHFTLAAKIESESPIDGVIAHIKGPKRFADFHIMNDIDSEELRERYLNTEEAKRAKDALYNHPYKTDESVFSIDVNPIEVYESGGAKFAIFNVTYADHAEAECGTIAYYQNDIKVWNLQTNKIETIESVGPGELNYYPFFIHSGEKITPWIFTELWNGFYRENVGVIDYDCGC